MTPRRRETRIPTNQPVRFYKIVALSFLFLTIILLGLIVFMSSKRATITITTKDTPVDVSLSVDAADVGGTVATTTVTVSERFFPEGDTEVPGEAVGTMIIHNDSGIQQPLVATTRFLSSDDVLFRLRNGVTVPANSTLAAEVYADQEGASGNIGPDRFTIPGLNEARQQEVYGVTEEAMEGGVRSVGILSKGDLEKAESTLLEKALDEASRRTTLTGDVVRSVASHETSVDAEIGDELSEFTVTITATIVEVSYEQDEATARAEESLLRRIVDDTETIEPAGEEARVSFESYDDIANKATLTVFFDGVASLNPESKQLGRLMFFGKTRDEARRYVLSLDHVQTVDVQFSPAWMQTIPHVNEHVNVIIKSVE